MTAAERRRDAQHRRRLADDPEYRERWRRAAENDRLTLDVEGNPGMPMVRKLEVFSVRDLRLRSSELVREAEAGQVSVITKRGKPVVVAVPFGTRLVDLGLDKDLALALFEQGLITLAKAAKLAGVTQDVFMDLMAEAGSVVRAHVEQELHEAPRTATRSCTCSPASERCANRRQARMSSDSRNG